MIRFSGLFTIIPATVFLTVSFFVLLGAGKAEEAGVKKFGRFVAVLLCLCAALVLGVGLFILATCRHPILMFLSEAGRACPACR